MTIFLYDECKKLKKILPTNNQWSYIDEESTRDLRIDFMRGFVFLILFTTHFNYFSWFTLIGWERFGVVSSAETFILLAGVVTGTVYGKKFRSGGLSSIITKLFTRAWALYKIALLVALSIALLHLIPNLNTQAVTNFIDENGKAFPLYPSADKGFIYSLAYIIFLKAGPHQFQIIGLYMVLFLITPIIFWSIQEGKLRALLLLSWLSYICNFFIPETEPGTAEIRLTGAQFEFAFPLLAWQFLFVHGVAIGYYRKKIIDFFSRKIGYVVIALCFLLTIFFLFFTLNNPLDKIPEWAKFSIISPETFDWWYQNFFLKYNLGPGRLVNNFVLMVTIYTLLTITWKPINFSLGWLLIPLGQESLYVFFIHVYLIILIENTSLSKINNAWINTLTHIGILLLCWIMVKKKFLFRWIPR